MKHTVATLLGTAAMLLASCVSVAPDAGTAGIERAVTGRGAPAPEWRTQPDPDGDQRVAALLEDELTADEAVAVAMMNSPRLQVTLAELGIARAELIEASTIANPIFEFEIRFPGEPYRPYELRLAQSIVDLIRLPARRELGRAAFDAAQLRISSEVLGFAGDVRSAYFDLVAATQHVALSRGAMAAAQTAAEVAVRQHAAENITDLDLENEQALYEQARLDLSRAEQQLLLAREALARLLGLRERAAEWRVAEAFPPLPGAEMSGPDVEALAGAQRLDLSIARREMEVARRRVPLARLEVLDEIVADFHYEREPGGERTRGPGIELPIPIFDTGRAARTRAEAEYLKARHALAVLEAESASLLRSATSAVDAARERVEYYRDVVVPRRERIVQLTKLEHNAMLVGVFQLLQAKQNEMQARRDFIEAQREYWGARTDLDRAIQGTAAGSSFVPATGRETGRRAGVTRGGH